MAAQQVDKVDLTVDDVPRLLDLGLTHSKGWKSEEMNEVINIMFRKKEKLDMEGLSPQQTKVPVDAFKIPIAVATEFRKILLFRPTADALQLLEAWTASPQENAQLPLAQTIFWFAALHAVKTSIDFQHHTKLREADFTGNIFNPIFSALAACFPPSLKVRYRCEYIFENLSWKPTDADLPCWRKVQGTMEANLKSTSLRADAVFSFELNSKEYIFATFEAKKREADSFGSPNLQSSMYAAIAMRDARRDGLVSSGLCFSSAGSGINFALMHNKKTQYKRMYNGYHLAKVGNALEFFCTLAHLPTYLLAVAHRNKDVKPPREDKK